MILIIGGAYQGKLNFAKNNLGFKDDNIYNNFHTKMKNWIETGNNPEDLLEDIFKSNIKVIISDEIGSGIVPIEKNLRLWRESVGRALCAIAQKCDSVWRVQCGIGIKIK